MIPCSLVVALLAVASPAGDDAPIVRTAIVVGANVAAEGRPALRYAHRDAEVIADVLASVGRFDPARVHVLRDPTPAQLLAVVEREAAALAGRPRSLLFFYYSGHAGDGALFTGGKRVSVDALRRLLDRADVSVRVGVVDACEGGGWTRAKGLVPDAPFEVTLPPLLESEGSALIASSSGAESAHESDALGGSFFTHHFAAALRGAADESGDGDVTLNEAFAYAREQTVSDTARHAREPQHPSFAVNLRGRQELVLAQVAASPSTLAVAQQEGPLEILHLASGVRVVELPPGARTFRLAVPPGRYLVRELAPDGVRAREIAVPRDGTTTVQERDLVLVGNARLAAKGEGAPVLLSTPRQWDGDVELGIVSALDAGSYATTVALGTGVFDPAARSLRVDARLGLTDRLTWKIGTLAFAYRFGRRGGVEIVPYAGVLGWRAAARTELGVRVGAGLGAAIPVGAGTLVATGGVAAYGGETGYERPAVDVGLGYRIASEHVTIHLAAGVSNRFLRYDDQLRELWIGSVQELGLAALPLVSVHGSAWALNLYAAHRDSIGTTGEIGVARRF